MLGLVEKKTNDGQVDSKKIDSTKDRALANEL
jgi:hypothetical protein